MNYWHKFISLLLRYLWLTDYRGTWVDGINIMKWGKYMGYNFNKFRSPIPELNDMVHRHQNKWNTSMCVNHFSNLLFYFLIWVSGYGFKVLSFDRPELKAMWRYNSNMKNNYILYIGCNESLSVLGDRRSFERRKTRDSSGC